MLTSLFIITFKHTWPCAYSLFFPANYEKYRLKHIVNPYQYSFRFVLVPYQNTSCLNLSLSFIILELATFVLAHYLFFRFWIKCLISMKVQIKTTQRTERLLKFGSLVMWEGNIIFVEVMSKSISTPFAKERY